jgi:hypothetical protein
MPGHLNVRFVVCLLDTKNTLMIRSRPVCATCVNIAEPCIFRAVFSAIPTLIRDYFPNSIHLDHSCYGDSLCLL